MCMPELIVPLVPVVSVDVAGLLGDAVVELELDELVFRMYSPIWLDASVVLFPVVERAALLSKHPLTVILSAAVVVALPLVVVLGLCAIAPNVAAHTNAAARLTVRFICDLEQKRVQAA